jgi:hypothetical protein
MGAPPRWALAVGLAIDAIALASVWRSRPHSRKSETVWTAVVLVLPAVGALAWCALGRDRRRGGRRLR